MVLSQQLDRMAEADAVRFHHPVDSRSAHVARAQTVPEILRRSDDKRRVAVVVERAQTQQVRPVPVQLDAPRLGQPLNRYLPLQPFDLMLRDSSHFQSSTEKPVKCFFALLQFFSPCLSIYMQCISGQRISGVIENGP